MADDELRLTRRFFLQQTSMSTALVGGLYSIAMKTDAMGQAPAAQAQNVTGEAIQRYPYSTP
ncbi:MAG: hypothetical protein KDA75_15960 [Planctomycetaceae bacterium]|nr:hypothetical protein [Planctomycetaceae bacterium]